MKKIQVGDRVKWVGRIDDGERELSGVVVTAWHSSCTLVCDAEDAWAGIWYIETARLTPVTDTPRVATIAEIADDYADAMLLEAGNLGVVEL